MWSTQEISVLCEVSGIDVGCEGSASPPALLRRWGEGSRRTGSVTRQTFAYCLTPDIGVSSFPRKRESSIGFGATPTTNNTMSRALRSILFSLCILIEAAQAQENFPKAIQSIFERNCVGCHNHAFLDKVDVSGGLALDSFDRVIGRKRPVVVPGNASASELVRRLESSDPQVRMPRGGERLPSEAIEAVRNWIDGGAKGENSTQAATASVPESPPPISIKPSEVFVPYGGRKAIEAGHPLEKRQATAPVVPLPGVLIVEEDADKAPNRVVEPYTKGLIGKIGPLPAVTSLAFSPDGKALLVGFYGRVAVWDLVNGGIVQELTDVPGSVNDLQFSPNGKLLSVVGGKPFSQGEIRLYDPERSATSSLVVRSSQGNDSCTSLQSGLPAVGNCWS